MKKQTNSKPLRRSLQRSLLETRKAVNDVLDNKYNSLNDFAQFVSENPHALTYEKNGKKRSLEATVLQSSSKSKNVFLFDRELTEQFTDQEVYVDGTFDAVPQIKGVHQLLVVHATKYNVVSNIF